MKFSIDISQEQRLRVYRQLLDGSDPRKTFFLMVAISTVIASLGLVTNSTAVVIGAMLVAPLMTPILGLALALVRGDAHLIRLALRAEVLGVAVSVLVGVIIGVSLPGYLDPTDEMVARTAPNLIDLLVAVFSGLAGAYALVDEKLSPVLPGVAISTAIVPPLANCGLSLAMGAYHGALGSFLLFFSNFLSILLVASLVFYIAGMAETLELRSGKVIARRFGVALAGFVIVSLLLTRELLQIVDGVRLDKEIGRIFRSELIDQRVNEIAPLQITREGGQITVLARLNAPTAIEPSEVRAIQDSLRANIGKPVTLFVRTTVTHEVSASDSLGADGGMADSLFPGRASDDPRVRALRQGEQLIRQMLDSLIGMHLEGLEVYPGSDVTVLMAEISGVRYLSQEEIAAIDDRLQESMPDTPLSLIVRQELTRLEDRAGEFRVEFSSPASALQDSTREQELRALARPWLLQRGFHIRGVSQTYLDGQLQLLLEVAGPRTLDPQEHRELTRLLESGLGEPMQLYVRSEIDSVLGPGGHTTLEELLNDYRQRNRETYPDETQRLIYQVR